MKRVIVIGSTASGKSTLARKIAQKHGLSVIDLDELFWLPGWQERPLEDFRAVLKEAVAAEGWVVAGNYTKRAQDIVWPLADTLIWLDISFWANFIALARRTFRRAISGEDICNGNRESLAQQLFTKDSLFLWFFKTWGEKRKKSIALFAAPQAWPHLKLIRLRSYAEARGFEEE